LNNLESLELARSCISSQSYQLLDECLRSNKLCCSEELGDLLVESEHLDMAVGIYMRAHIPDKVIDTLMRLGSCGGIIRYVRLISYQPDYASLLRKCSQLHSEICKLEFALLLLTGEENGTPLLDLSTVSSIMGFHGAANAVQIMKERLAQLKAQSLLDEAEETRTQ